MEEQEIVNLTQEMDTIAILVKLKNGNVHQIITKKEDSLNLLGMVWDYGIVLSKPIIGIDF